MKKNQISRDVASFNRAAFRVGPEHLAGDALEGLLARVLGGSTSCTSFTCNLYAPPPPPPPGS
jgi:hypothetical protein